MSRPVFLKNGQQVKVNGIIHFTFLRAGRHIPDPFFKIMFTVLLVGLFEMAHLTRLPE